MRRFVLGFILLLCIASGTGCAGHPENIAVGTFNLNDFSSETQWYTNELMEELGLTAESSLGPAPDAATALQKGEEMLWKVYGKEESKREYPSVSIAYDGENGAWMVAEDREPTDEPIACGTAPTIIFLKDDGKIIMIYASA